MKEVVVNKLMLHIKKKNTSFDDIKLEEIRYGLYGLYTLITKSIVVIILSIILGFFKNFILFILFYGILRGVGYGTHAKSNLTCWIFSTILLLGIPYLFTNIILSNSIKSIIWCICFINFLIFCPADTEKRPMINRLRKLKFKTAILFISIIYLIIIFKVNVLSNILLASMVLETLLTNPLGYILMGQKVRFKISDIFILKQRSIKKEVC